MRSSVNNIFEGMWNEMVFIQFNVLFRLLPEDTEENQENLKLADLRAEI
jgi:hypothetical protein